MVCVSGDPEEWKSLEKRLRSRCWGYYVKRRDAASVIECNGTDMSELGYYRYAVLTKLGEGPMAISEELQWYEFIWNWNVNPRADGVVIPEFVEAKKINKPGKYQNILFGDLSFSTKGAA